MSETYIGRNSAFTATADAIREKSKSTDLITWEEETGFEQAVLAIEGGGLNFEVVGGTTEPTDPAENTLWVNTSVDIGKWTVSASAPSNPAQGDVWAAIATVSSISADVMDENDIILNLGEVKQYNGSAWETSPAMIYQNGEWAEFDPSFYMIKDGALVLAPSMTSGATFENGDGYVSFKGSGGGYWCGWFPDVYIDGSKHSMLIINGTFTASGSDTKFYFAIWESSVTPEDENYKTRMSYKSSTNEYTIDVSSLNGTYHVGLVSTFTYEQQITAMYLAE